MDPSLVLVRVETVKTCPCRASPVTVFDTRGVKQQNRQACVNPTHPSHVYMWRSIATYGCCLLGRIGAYPKEGSIRSSLLLFFCL